MPAQGGEITVAAAILLDGDGRMLLVRKRGTVLFMQPGGKAETGESFAGALCREVEEETGLVLAPEELTPRGVFRAPAANEAGMIVVAHVFSAQVFSTEARASAIACAAEIEECAWVDPLGDPQLPLAALTRDHLLPLAHSLVREAR